MSIALFIIYFFYSPVDKRDRSDRGERVARYGDWSEHVSSSGKWTLRREIKDSCYNTSFLTPTGKMYYYNCKTEVSQWEKPKEWVDRER